MHWVPASTFCKPSTVVPKSRAEVCRLLELVTPSPFHRLLFTREPEADPAWTNLAGLGACYPLATKLYDVRLPKNGPGRAARELVFKCAALNTRLDWRMPVWELEVFRQCNGRRTLAEIMERISRRIPEPQLQEQLYMLHHLLVLTVSPKKIAPR